MISPSEICINSASTAYNHSEPRTLHLKGAHKYRELFLGYLPTHISEDETLQKLRGSLDVPLHGGVFPICSGDAKVGEKCHGVRHPASNQMLNVKNPSSYNLSSPSLIPGFKTRLTFDRNPTMILYEVFTNAVEGMAHFAFMPWDSHALIQRIIMGMGYTERIDISPWPRGVRGLQVKHCVQALYDTGFALARKPLTRSGYVPKVYAGLFLRDRQIGYMKWLSAPPREMNGGGGSRSNSKLIHNSTVALIRSDASNQTGLQAVGETTGTIVDPTDPRLAIRYTIFGQPIPLPDTWTAILNALATAAPHSVHETGAAVDAAGVSGETILHVQETGTPPFLNWGTLINAVRLIWKTIVDNHWYQAWDFDLTYDGATVGEGYIWNLRTTRASRKSSQ
ncbi:MAG: hypothetical protein Q9210_003888 [Variospora velana]